MTTIHQALEKARQHLLDLSTRNRLLSIPQSSRARLIRVEDEISREILRLMVFERRRMSFQPTSEPDADSDDVGDTADGDDDGDDDSDDDGYGAQPQPEDDGDPDGIAARHQDNKLQTRLLSEALQRRLLSMFYDARTAIEEQGVNTLFLALGQLQWVDQPTSDTERWAPLILLPVALERTNANTRFRLQALPQEPSDNLSLVAKLAEFGIEAPPFEWQDDFDFDAYCRSFEQAIASQSTWKVHANAIVLGFFSFSKFLMYRDLDPNIWPEAHPLDAHRLITGLLGDGFGASEPLLSEDQPLDKLIPVEELNHVVDADSSQALAIEEVRRGRNMIIQGPPGTGKSQTITNLIATAVHDGKTVLFVAEKLAALEVVQRRLDEIGLDAIALELHSHRANKRQLLEELAQTLKLGRPESPVAERLMSVLGQLRGQLNDHANRLNEPRQPCGLTLFDIMGQLTRLEASLGDRQVPRLLDADTWSPDDHRQRHQLMIALRTDLAAIGIPRQHPWFGVQCFDLNKFDIAEIAAEAARLATSLRRLRSHCQALTERFDLPPIDDLDAARDLSVRAHWVTQAPALDATALGAEAWLSQRPTLHKAVAAGCHWRDAIPRIDRRFTFEAWDTDVSRARRHLAAHGDSLLRWFYRDYRQAMAELRAVLKTGRPPKELEEQLRWLDDLMDAQRHRQEVSQHDELASRCFGRAWTGQVDWHALQSTLDWVSSVEDAGHLAEVLAMRSTVECLGDCAELAETLRLALDRFEADVQALSQRLRLDTERSLGQGSVTACDLTLLEQRLDRWSQQEEALSKWTAYTFHAQQASDLGLHDLLIAIEDGAVTADDVVPMFSLAYHKQIYRHLLQGMPELQHFDGEVHQQRVEAFRDLDRQRIAWARFEVLARHHEALPNHSSTAGVLGHLLSEMKRKRGHMPIRKLIAKTGPAIQAIKPVFMMSPLSVAQFLAPGAVTFDLVIFDEASQVEPVDALGAIARGHQWVVVGDEQQLPPSRFFAKMGLDSDLDRDLDGENDGVAAAGDIESVLGLAEAKGLPSRMLRWHYRSRHPSLIAVSNEQFYGGDLYIVPSPMSRSASHGLQFHHVADGFFSPGSRGYNRKEAQAVAKAVMEHASEHPEASLGVAAFSVRQRDAILVELENLRRTQLQKEPFFLAHPFEPFFVKNLENVQGDERDVIFISVGYAPDADGNFPMRFGPLNNDGGERRLNVLISRAKQRCVVFSSIVAEQIDTRRSSRRGVVALQAFLRFAETGQLATATTTVSKDAEHPFEVTVKEALESRGYEVRMRVGTAGFYLDLAIVDPEDPDRYLLGIECDGPSYNAARSARERDRQRNVVLEAHGWTLHRLWSSDWFQRPQEQLSRLLAAIEQAKTRALSPPATLPDKEPPSELARPSRQATPQGGGRRALAVPYREAQITVPWPIKIDHLPQDQLAQLVTQILDIEAPVHRSEVVARLHQLWQGTRASSKTKEACDAAIAWLLDQGRASTEDGFLSLATTETRIRDRAAVSSATLRKSQFLPPQEIELAILSLVQHNHGLSPQEVAKVVSQTLGYKALSRQLRQVIEASRDHLRSIAKLTLDEGFLQVVRQ